MRNRINKNLVYTTSVSKTKASFAERNNIRVKYVMSIMGVRKYITADEYRMLKKAGYNVYVEMQ